VGQALDSSRNLPNQPARREPHEQEGSNDRKSAAKYNAVPHGKADGREDAKRADENAQSDGARGRERGGGRADRVRLASVNLQDATSQGVLSNMEFRLSQRYFAGWPQLALEKCPDIHGSDIPGENELAHFGDLLFGKA
jgi:hypothetical protein